MLEESDNDSSYASEEGVETPAQSGNAAWAEVMGKILNKQGPKDSSSVILAKNKENSEENKQERIEQRERRKQLNKKRKWEEMNYVKPNVLDKDYEKSLQKIATRGVVQLFNAVKKHQKQIEEKMKGAKTEGKRDKVMKSVSKGEFLDMLKMNKGTKVDGKDGSSVEIQSTALSTKNQLNQEDDNNATWKVLRDDFMMGNKMKDWDKCSDDEE